MRRDERSGSELMNSAPMGWGESGAAQTERAAADGMGREGGAEGKNRCRWGRTRGAAAK